MMEMRSLNDWVFVQEMRQKVEAGETLTEEDVANLRRLVDWLDLHALTDEGFPSEWAT